MEPASAREPAAFTRARIEAARPVPRSVPPLEEARRPRRRVRRVAGRPLAEAEAGRPTIVEEEVLPWA